MMRMCATRGPWRSCCASAPWRGGFRRGRGACWGTLLQGSAAVCAANVLRLRTVCHGQFVTAMSTAAANVKLCLNVTSLVEQDFKQVFPANGLERHCSSKSMFYSQNKSPGGLSCL